MDIKLKQVLNSRGVYRKYFKRLMDLILSLFAIIILSPILLLIALLTRLRLGSPILFKANRPGLDEKIFTMYKFRSMTDNKDEEGELLPDSMRATKFGNFLRATSLDELPELFNIIKGDMSIVGPRPLVISYLPYYNDFEKQRHNIRPGLTGLAQINGRSSSSWKKKFRHDIDYLNNITFINDIKIIFYTVLKVVKKEDVVEPHLQTDFNLEREKELESLEIEIDGSKKVKGQ